MIPQTFKKKDISLLVAFTACCSGVEQALQLEKVIVTAQKRSQSLQDVPMSVFAINAQQMEEAGIQTLADLSLYMPTLETK